MYTVKEQHTATNVHDRKNEQCRPCGKQLLDHKRSFILESKRQTQKQRGEGQREICFCTRMSFQCETKVLPAKTLWYVSLLRAP